MKRDDVPTKFQLGDAPIENEFRLKMNMLAHEIDKFFNGELRGKDRKVGFVTIVFNFGDDNGRASYISNADRTDVVRVLKEWIARFEGQPEMRGKA